MNQKQNILYFHLKKLALKLPDLFVHESSIEILGLFKFLSLIFD